MSGAGVAGQRTRRPRWLLAGQLALAALVGGGLSMLTGLDIIWIVGGVAGGGLAYRVARRRSPELPPSARSRKLGQILVGAAIGPSLATQRLAAAPEQLALLVGGVLAILAGSLLVARAYAARGEVDAVTAGMATLPGGLSIMPSVAAELGRPAGLVAIVQATRMTLVVVMVVAVLPLGPRAGPCRRGTSRCCPDPRGPGGMRPRCSSVRSAPPGRPAGCTYRCPPCWAR